MSLKEPIDLKTYEVEYKIIHKRIFHVPDKSYIKCMLSEKNNVEIISIKEV